MEMLDGYKCHNNPTSSLASSTRTADVTRTVRSLPSLRSLLTRSPADDAFSLRVLRLALRTLFENKGAMSHTDYALQLF